MKGYNTLDSVVIAITRHSRKVLDGQIIAKFVHVCAIYGFLIKAGRIWQKVTKPCFQKKYKKSSHSLELQGAVDLFSYSSGTGKRKYISQIYRSWWQWLIYKSIVLSEPYVDFIPKKLECINHVQKWLGARLRKQLKEKKSKIL